MRKVYKLKNKNYKNYIFSRLFLFVECDRRCRRRPSRPICGSDGITYDNRCRWKCESGRYVTIKSRGKCKGKC